MEDGEAAAITNLNAKHFASDKKTRGSKIYTPRPKLGAVGGGTAEENTGRDILEIILLVIIFHFLSGQGSFVPVAKLENTLNEFICCYNDGRQTRFQLILRKRSGYIRAWLVQFCCSAAHVPSGGCVFVCVCVCVCVRQCIYPRPLRARDLQQACSRAVCNKGVYLFIPRDSQLQQTSHSHIQFWQ